MKQAFKKYTPAFVVVGLLFVFFFFFGFTDLRFYFQNPYFTIRHVVSTVKPTVTKIDKSFSFTFDIEAPYGSDAGQKVFSVDGHDVFIYLTDVYDSNMGGGFTENSRDLQARVTLVSNIVKTDKGISILSFAPYPDLNSDYYKKLNNPFGNGTYTYQLDSGNLTAEINGEIFQMSLKDSLFQNRLSSKLNGVLSFFSYDVFKHSYDFAINVAQPQNKLIKVTVDGIYLSEYEINPILKGVF